MDHPMPEKHKDQAQNNKRESDTQNLIQEVDTPPNNKPANDPKRSPNDKDNVPSPPQSLAVVLDWLRHYWDTPREKSKWADIASVVLTSLIAVAAFCSAYIFQGQLTEVRRATDITERQWKQHERPWVHQTAHHFCLTDAPAGKNIDAWIQVDNTGRSPALHAKVLANWVVDIIDADERGEGVQVPKECTLDDAPPKYKDRKLKEWPLFPLSVNVGANYGKPDIPLSDADFAAISDTKKTIYMTGCAFYTDGAGMNYRTQICMKYPNLIHDLKYRKRDLNGCFDGLVFLYCLTGNYTEHKEKGKYVRD